MRPPAPARTDVLLVGGGHAHVTVLRAFAMRPEPGVRLTLVAKELAAPYSGMLPGLVAGRYAPDEVHIDLVRLAAVAGARLVHGEADGLDLDARRLSLPGRPPLAFGLLSIDVGITPSLDGIEGADRHALAVKPISGFWPRWTDLAERALRPDGPRSIVVVGGGAAGFELVLAAAARLRSEAPSRGIDPAAFAFTLVSGDALLATLAPRAARLARAALARADVRLVEGDGAASVAADALTLASGRVLAADAVLVTTRAAPPAFLAATGLPLDDRGFLALRPTLQSTGRDDVLAAGDCASVLEHPRPKAGVFAVRQGPVLADNLRRLARGERPRPFVPQSRFLTLLATADGSAIAARGGLAAAGRWAYAWKDRIDRRFMARFQDLPAMGGADEEEMRCGGCAAKVGPATLAAALDRFGSDTPRDDAAVVDEGGGDLRLETVDFFRAFWPDPWLLGRIAAHHAVSDVLAMGGRPDVAQAICVLPHMAPRLAAEDLFQLLAGARASLEETGARLVGGHSSEGAELAVGFAVSGRVPRGRLARKGGLADGDVLVLGRAIGTGVLFAGAMRGLARGADVAAALSDMSRPQVEAADALIAAGCTAATDVTGFGLAGHLLEMLEASGVGAELDLASVPLRPGALALARAGVASTLLSENLALVDRLAGPADAATLALLFDPQTAGGLLAGVRADAAGHLRPAGFVPVGRVVAADGGPRLRLVGRF